MHSVLYASVKVVERALAELKVVEAFSQIMTGGIAHDSVESWQG